MSFDLAKGCANPATSFGDRNGDGIVTISDIWRLLGDVVSLPGDAVIAMLLNDRQSGAASGLANFLELSCGSLSGSWSTTLSAVLWAMVILGWLISLAD